jgi:hypothetical protein
MKKRVLAVVLAAAMVSGTCMTAMADQTHEGEHGSAGEAVVSTDVDEMYTNKVEKEVPIPDKTSGQTQFYLKVDKDATSGDDITIPSTDEEKAMTPGVCHYEIVKATSKKATLSVTVPLYVCMYGYGGDGKVITPEDDTYQMVNNSTYSKLERITNIYKCYEVIPITSINDYPNEYVTSSLEKYEAKYKEDNPDCTDEELQTKLAEKRTEYTQEAADEEKLYETYIKNIIKDDNTSDTIAAVKGGQYGYYTTDKNTASEKNIIVELNDCNHHAGSSTCTNEYFYRTSTSKTDAGIEVTPDTTEETPEVAYLPVNIPTIKAESYTWKIKPAINRDRLNAGEIAMTINGLDLSDVESKADHTLDIKALGWVIEGEAKAKKVEYPLPVKAAIAGGSVNEDEDCVPVVRVTYTVAPAYDFLSNANANTNANANGEETTTTTTTETPEETETEAES